MAKAPCKELSSLSLGKQFPFHLLHDRKTEMYIKFAKVMVICQGPYSETRAHYLKMIEKKYPSAACILSDETYSQTSKRSCEAETTDEYFGYFKEQIRNALETGSTLIYIDATMSHLNLNRYFCAVANKSQYVTLVMPPVVTERGPSEWPKKSQAKSFELYSERRVEAPNMFEHLFCGWFLHDMDTEELRNQCALYCNDLFEYHPQFAEWWSQKGTAETFPKYFRLTKEDLKKEDQIMREDLAFCPVKIFTSEYEMTKYFSKASVQENYGKMSKLYIVGFVVSPYMVAARVHLTHKQKDLWERDDAVREDGYLEIFPSELYKKSKSLPYPNPDVIRICSKSNVTIVDGRYSHEPAELIPDNAKGRTCHIVLGTSEDASSAEIDYGVPFAVNREIKAKNAKVKEMGDLIDTGHALVRRVGKYWFIYLKTSLVVDGFFASCCMPCAFDTPLKDWQFDTPSKDLKKECAFDTPLEDFKKDSQFDKPVKDLKKDRAFDKPVKDLKKERAFDTPLKDFKKDF